MALAITAGPSGELLSVDEAKRHLRLYSSDLDDEIASLVRAARDYCERYTARTLRNTVTRTLTLAKWWPSHCVYEPYRTRTDHDSLRLPWPPLIAVSSIAYYDTDNASQTLNSSNYATEIGADGAGRIIWSSTATIPAVYDRPDAITVTFTTGYTTLDSTTAPLPPVALQAMKTKCTELWGSGTDNEIKAAQEATDRLLGMVEWTGYA